MVHVEFAGTYREGLLVCIASQQVDSGFDDAMFVKHMQMMAFGCEKLMLWEWLRLKRIHDAQCTCGAGG